jgi:hypothetical protein
MGSTTLLNSSPNSSVYFVRYSSRSSFSCIQSDFVRAITTGTWQSYFANSAKNFVSAGVRRVLSLVDGLMQYLDSLTQNSAEFKFHTYHIV